jgi:hypothetical protein
MFENGTQFFPETLKKDFLETMFDYGTVRPWAGCPFLVRHDHF